MKKTFKIFLILTIFYAIMIFYLSSISDLKLPKEWLIQLSYYTRLLQHNDYMFLLSPFYPLLKQQDKVLHILLYFGFGILLFLTLKSMDRPVIKALALAFFIGILYGATDEFHQSFVPGRSANIMDFVADITGLLFAMSIFIIFYFIKLMFFYLVRLKNKKITR